MTPAERLLWLGLGLGAAWALLASLPLSSWSCS